MNKKVEELISKKTWKTLLWTKATTAKMGVDIYSISFLTKLHKYYMEFLDILFKIISTLTVSATFLFFLPIYLKLGWERTGVIVLVVILLKLQFGKIKITFE